jgi:hypothetical protein
MHRGLQKFSFHIFLFILNLHVAPYNSQVRRYNVLFAMHLQEPEVNEAAKKLCNKRTTKMPIVISL